MEEHTGRAPYRKSVSQGLYGVRKTDVVFRYSSKIRAVCVSSACTDLCGVVSRMRESAMLYQR